MAASKIEWTQATWNPIVGCSIVSPGCTNCYAMAMAARIEAMNTEARECSHRKPSAPHYDGTTHKVNGHAVWTGKLARASEKTLLEPLRSKRPTTYFVNSMSDLFHEAVPDEWIDTVFAVMALAPQHTFQVLTKRASRARDYLSEEVYRKDGIPPIREMCVHKIAEAIHGTPIEAPRWPLPNVWLGVSTERQKEADERIPHLLATPAAVRFISAEPLLGPVDLFHIREQSGFTFNTLIRKEGIGFQGGALDWVIVGGESGPGSRPMHPDWARSLRDQCAAAGVPFFFKQWGNWYPVIDRDKEGWDRAPSCHEREPQKYRVHNYAGGQGFHGERVHLMQRYGKKAAGRELDGIVHNELPVMFRGHCMIVDQLEGAAP